MFHELFWNSSSTHLSGFLKRIISVAKIPQLVSNGLKPGAALLLCVKLKCQVEAVQWTLKYN